MLKWLSNLFGDPNERELKNMWPVVDEINEHVARFEALSDEELRGKTEAFKEQIREATAGIDARTQEIRAELRRAPAHVPGPAGALVGGDGAVPGNGAAGDGLPALDGEAAENGQPEGAPAAPRELTLDERRDLLDEMDDLEDERRAVVQDVLDELLPEAFAVVKETCRRMLGEQWTAGGMDVTWDMVPYDVQLLGGVVLHQGRVAEMKTGEGKTLVAVLPVYLNALTGQGVHLITVNPYLAERDAEWMGPIFAFHGLTVDVVDRYEPHSAERRKAYRADITYGTNNEFGFDYLRDNSFVVRPEQLVQRDHYYAIIDEVDSVLIDEARTPLIISGPVPTPQNDRYSELQTAVEKVVRQQKKIVRELADEAGALLEERGAAQEAGDKKRASRAEDEAGLALLRASRGYQKDEKLLRLLGEQGNERLRLKTEYLYLQDNAKRMPFVDEVLLFALDEKQRSIEMTEEGRLRTATAAGQEEDLFVLPDLGEEIAAMERRRDQVLREKEAALNGASADAEHVSGEEREAQLAKTRQEQQRDMEEKKRELYATYSERAERLHAIEQLLKAYTLFEKDTDYIVEEGSVKIVDEHTGRVLSGRRYSDGLHQAIEAKEQVEVQKATQTYATITLQNYFRMYDKLAGMTGTAETEAEEFSKIYGMDVVVVPTNEPIVRDDGDDLIFKSKRAKYQAVVDRIRELHEGGQPTLVGTTSVEVSELLSRRLQREGIRHNVLNAKKDRAKKEADIVAEAGRQGAVTIATNMAGRGTDIKLGEGVREAGGLAIVGTERHESRRIDLQLRGRSGRQGDPGESQFYVSLEDDLMRLFGQDRVAKVMDRLNLEEDAVITHPWINKSIERAQGKVEQNHFAIRKRQLDYDDVLNAQREVIYDRRQHALKGERFHAEVMAMLHDVVDKIVGKHYGDGNFEELREELLRTLAFDFEADREELVHLGEEGTADRVYEAATEHYGRKRAALAQPFYQRLKQLTEQGDGERRPDRVFVDFTDGQRLLRTLADVDDALETQGYEINDALERTVMLSIIDERWTEHLRELDELKEGIGLRSFGRKDPLVEYKMDAYGLFAELMERISDEVVALCFKAGPLVEKEAAAKRTAPAARLDRKRARTQHDSAEPSYGVDSGGNAGGNEAAQRDPTPDGGQQTVVVGDKPGRNDPCPCGSGKKYKHCCGR